MQQPAAWQQKQTVSQSANRLPQPAEVSPSQPAESSARARQLSSQPGSQPVSQAASEATSQPARQPASQAASQPGNQPASQAASQPQTASQPGLFFAALLCSTSPPAETRLTVYRRSQHQTYVNGHVSIRSRRATSFKKMKESALHHVRDGRRGTRQARSEADRDPSSRH